MTREIFDDLYKTDFSDGSDGLESAHDAGEHGSILGLNLALLIGKLQADTSITTFVSCASRVYNCSLHMEGRLEHF